jgi:nitrogen regulatory protein P-II 1
MFSRPHYAVYASAPNRQAAASKSLACDSAQGYILGMKLIIAIIQPSRLEEVKAALTDVEVFRLTVMDCQGFGRQKGRTEIYRGREFSVNLTRKVQLQIAVNEDFVEPTISAIINGGRTGEKGEIGDGKIFVLPLEDCIRIRTGERGPEAI